MSIQKIKQGIIGIHFCNSPLRFVQYWWMPEKLQFGHPSTEVPWMTDNSHSSTVSYYWFKDSFKEFFWLIIMNFLGTTNLNE